MEEHLTREAKRQKICISPDCNERKDDDVSLLGYNEMEDDVSSLGINDAVDADRDFLRRIAYAEASRNVADFVADIKSDYIDRWGKFSLSEAQLKMITASIIDRIIKRECMNPVGSPFPMRRLVRHIDVDDSDDEEDFLRDFVRALGSWCSFVPHYISVPGSIAETITEGKSPKRKKPPLRRSRLVKECLAILQKYDDDKELTILTCSERSVLRRRASPSRKIDNVEFNMNVLRLWIEYICEWTDSEPLYLFQDALQMCYEDSDDVFMAFLRYLQCLLASHPGLLISGDELCESSNYGGYMSSDDDESESSYVKPYNDL